MCYQIENIDRKFKESNRNSDVKTKITEMKYSWEELHNRFKQAEDLVNLNIGWLTLPSLGNRIRAKKRTKP